jgi:hypothetical protein
VAAFIVRSLDQRFVVMFFSWYLLLLRESNKNNLVSSLLQRVEVSKYYYTQSKFSPIGTHWDLLLSMSLDGNCTATFDRRRHQSCIKSVIVLIASLALASLSSASVFNNFYKTKKSTGTKHTKKKFIYIKH